MAAGGRPDCGAERQRRRSHPGGRDESGGVCRGVPEERERLRWAGAGAGRGLRWLSAVVGMHAQWLALVVSAQASTAAVVLCVFACCRCRRGAAAFASDGALCRRRCLLTRPHRLHIHGKPAACGVAVLCCLLDWSCLTGAAVALAAQLKVRPCVSCHCSAAHRHLRSGTAPLCSELPIPGPWAAPSLPPAGAPLLLHVSDRPRGGEERDHGGGDAGAAGRRSHTHHQVGCGHVRAEGMTACSSRSNGASFCAGVQTGPLARPNGLPCTPP